MSSQNFNEKIKRTFCFLFFVFIFSFFGVRSVYAEYYKEGMLASTNLLGGLTNVGSITQFSATTYIPTGTTLTVQFSRDGIVWYDSANTAYAENSLSNGSNTISLSTLNWSGPTFYYKLHYTTTDPGITPTISQATVDYSPGSGAVYFRQGSLVSTDLLSGGGSLSGNELFSYNISSLPAGTTVTVQFSTSTDVGDWYGSDGTLWGSDTLTSGSHKTEATAINLSALNLSGSSFYYKLQFTNTDSATTPTVTEIGLFSSGESPVVATTPNVKLSSSPAVAGAPGWYASLGTWNYRKKISVNQQKVASTTGPSITNFPMLVSLTDGDLKFTGSGGKVASSTGGDILFTSDNGTTMLNFEIEKYVPATGELVAWVNIPTLSSISNTPIYIYFGNASATNNQNPTLVWDANYKGVWHLKEPTGWVAGGAGYIQDSTSNKIDGQAYGNANTITGKVNGGGIFDGNEDYIDFGASPAGGLSAITVQAWVKPAYSNSIMIIEDGAGYETNSFYIYLNQGRPEFEILTNNNYDLILSNSVISTTQWTHLVLTWQSGTRIKMFVNGREETGSLRGDMQTGTLKVGDRNLFIGGRPADPLALDYDGSVDETRISSIARPADWIKTEYNNQSSPSTFYGVGGLESQSGRVNSAGDTVPAIKVRGGVKFR